MHAIQDAAAATRRCGAVRCANTSPAGVALGSGGSKMVDQIDASQLRAAFEGLRRDATGYFNAVDALIPVVPDDPWPSAHGAEDRDQFWGLIGDEQRGYARQLAQRTLDLAGRLAEAARSSPLTSDADIRDVMLAAKTIRAALMLRRFRYLPLEVLHDEGLVLGVQPPSQTDDEPVAPAAASRIFDESLAKMLGIEELVIAASTLQSTGLVHAPGSAKYRPGTAFIIMAMNKANRELDDVVDAVKEVFAEYGIRAVRADDIEHEDLITQRIISELETAEFLLADLSLERPNVYYEVGYAHALKRRVILIRKAGTGLHFDLAGYNCPEYENIRDLKELLHQRLKHATNKEPRRKI
jgi:hypothetical protein